MLNSLLHNNRYGYSSNFVPKLKITVAPLQCIDRYPISAAVLALIIFCWPSRFAAKYEYIKGLDIRQELVEKATKNISLSLGPKCDYEELIEENLGMYKPPFTEQVLNNYNVQPGGEFHPSDCTSRFSTAIIVPYRQREEQLNKFLVYMHNFLRRQKIHYRIFVIEQLDPKPFNRAKLLNIGAMIAMRFDFPCLVLQDVDLLPTNLGHIYACTRRPRHMCAALDKFRYNLPYNEIAGGAIAIQSRTFLTVNGFSSKGESLNRL